MRGSEVIELERLKSISQIITILILENIGGVWPPYKPRFLQPQLIEQRYNAFMVWFPREINDPSFSKSAPGSVAKFNGKRWHCFGFFSFNLKKTIERQYFSKVKFF